MTWKCGSVEAALGAAWKVSSVSSHQMSGFNLSQRASGKVMIQMLSPSSTGLQLSTRGKEKERGVQSGRKVVVCLPRFSPISPPYYCTSSFIMSVPVQQSSGSFVGEGRDWLGWPGTPGRLAGIYILTVELWRLNKSQSAPRLWDPFFKLWQSEPNVSSFLSSPLLSLISPANRVLQ